jgi:acyl carrier protein
VTPLESLIMDTLKISDVSVVRAANHLRTIGLDSLLAVELRTKIKSAFGQTVPIRTLLGSITPAGLGDLVTGAEPSTAGGTR